MEAMRAPLALLLLSLAVAASASRVKVNTRRSGSGTSASRPVASSISNGVAGRPVPLTVVGGRLRAVAPAAPSPASRAGAAAPAALAVSAEGPAASAAPAAAQRASSPQVEAAREALRPVFPSEEQEGPEAAAREAAPGARAAPSANAALGSTAREIRAQGSAGAADGAAVRAALDRAFDAQAAAGGRVGGGVAGRDQDLRGRIEQTLHIARAAPPADAPAHYRAALELAEEKLPAKAAAAVASAVRELARAKAERALPELASDAYAAAAAGQAGETKRLLKGFDAWEALLGAPGRPLVANARMLKTSVGRRLEGARKGESGAGPARRSIPFLRRGGSYVAALPDSAVQPLPASLKASFALAPAPAPAAAHAAAAWAAYRADPRLARGFAEVYKARLGMGGTVPEAALSAGVFWLRALLAQLREALRWLFGGRAYALGAPSGEARLRADAALASEVAAAGAAARALLSAESPTVGSARASLAALRRQAESHERLRGRGARAASAALAAALAAEARGLPDSAPLPPAARDALGAAQGELQRLARDAREHVDGRVFAAAGPSGLSLAQGTRRWVVRPSPRGPLKLSADLRGTGAGGFVSLSAPGDAELAGRLAELGFAVSLRGGALSATLDAEAADLDAGALAALSDQALLAAAGAAPAPRLSPLVAAIAADPGAAAARARALDGRAHGGRLLGLVTFRGEEYEAVSKGRALFLRAGGVPAFAAP